MCSRLHGAAAGETPRGRIAAGLLAGVAFALEAARSSPFPALVELA